MTDSTMDLMRGARWSLWFRAVVGLAIGSAFWMEERSFPAVVIGFVAFALLVDGSLGLLRLLVPPRPAWLAHVWPAVLWAAGGLAGILLLVTLERKESFPAAGPLVLLLLAGFSALMYLVLAWLTPGFTRWAVLAWSAWWLSVTVFLGFTTRLGNPAGIWGTIPIGVALVVVSAVMLLVLFYPDRRVT